MFNVNKLIIWNRNTLKDEFKSAATLFINNIQNGRG